MSIPAHYYDCLTFQAIENFALTLKTTARMLQTFGACLATTELPRGVPSTEELLMSHTRQWDKLQVSGQWPLTIQPLCQQLVSLLARAGGSIKSFPSLFSSDLAAADHPQPSRQTAHEDKNLLSLGGTCRTIAMKTCEKHPSKGKLILPLCAGKMSCGSIPSRAVCLDLLRTEQHTMAEIAGRAESQLAFEA